MPFEQARHWERERDLVRAADAYEQCLAEGDRRLAVRLNLALLYWHATDFGLASAKQLKPAFVERASVRSEVLLEEAAAAFPDSTEVRFWIAYIGWASYGKAELAVDDCLMMLQRDPETLAPAFHVFAQSNGTRCESEALELLEQCRNERTERARYIGSVIEGVLHRRRPRAQK